MPRALSMSIREEIIRLHQQGHELTVIAAELQLSYHSVRQIWRLYRRDGGDGLTPRYHACARASSPGYSAILQQACELKRLHPTWGAGLIRIQLKKEFINQNMPSVRTLQYSFRAAGVNRPRRPRRPRQSTTPALRVHEVWQVDAVEKAKLADGREASWLAVTDEFSGASLDPELSPPGAVATDPRDRGPDDVPPHLRALGVA